MRPATLADGTAANGSTSPDAPEGPSPTFNTVTNQPPSKGPDQPGPTTSAAPTHGAVGPDPNSAEPYARHRASRFGPGTVVAALAAPLLGDGVGAW